ncbi:MAG: 16S rRNA processing protein RimM [Chitinispirillaceae bacterium]|nr:16S rRNA processing protein RimM [Chitinispirillaceae bacterium]
MSSEEWIAVGIVRRPVGLRGLCAVEPFGATLAALRAPAEVRIGKDIAGAGRVIIEELVLLPNGLRCGFESRKDRTAVEGLRGSLIFIEKKALPVRAEGSYYHFELKGAGVYSDRDGGRIGTVVEVHHFPASDTLEVEREGGAPLLLPLSDQAVAAIDTVGGRITVRQSFVEELLQ